MSLIRSMRGGKDYDRDLGKAHDRQRSLRQDDRAALCIATRRLGLNKKRVPLDTGKFRFRARAGDQLALSL